MLQGRSIAVPVTTFTANWVRLVKPPEVGRVDWFDDHLVGLGLRISFTGTKTWFVRYRAKADGARRRVNIGEYPAITLGDARERAHSTLLDLARGDDPGLRLKAHKAGPTFGKLAEAYIERYAKLRKRSWEEDQKMQDRDLLPAWENRKANDITRREVMELLEAIRDRGAPVRANRTLACVRKIYNWGIEAGLLETNPCYQVKAVAKETRRDRVLTTGEIRAIWKAIEQQSEVMAALFKIRFLTAQRGGEVQAMRWADVDLKGGWWTIPANMAKNGISHRVPLSEPAIAILKRLQKVSGEKEWVFPGRKKGTHVQEPKDTANRLRELSGVEFVPHDFRRTAASTMARVKIPRLVIAKVLNHVSIDREVTAVYDRYAYDSEKREALDLWAERLIGIVG
jgi:integrase